MKRISGEPGNPAMARRSKDGFTLIELVVVIVLLSGLMGMSIVLLTNAERDLGVRAAADQLMATLRSVREFARSEGVAAWVVLDKGDPPAMYSLRRNTVGMWHFESRNGSSSPGAFDQDALLTRVNSVQGRLGNAFALRRNSTIRCGEIPIRVPGAGISVDFWLYRYPSSGEQTIFSIGEDFVMQVVGEGRLRARIGDLRLAASRGLIIPFEAWVQILFLYNGQEARLFANGVPVSTKRGKAEWARNSPLVIGGKTRSVVGIIDEFRIGLILPGNRYELPGEVEFDFPKGTLRPNQAEVWIHFDSEGRLDSRRHGEPFAVKLKSKDEQTKVTVSLTGIASRE